MSSTTPRFFRKAHVFDSSSLASKPQSPGSLSGWLSNNGKKQKKTINNKEAHHHHSTSLMTSLMTSFGTSSSSSSSITVNRFSPRESNIHSSDNKQGDFLSQKFEIEGVCNEQRDGTDTKDLVLICLENEILDLKECLKEAQLKLEEGKRLESLVISLRAELEKTRMELAASKAECSMIKAQAYDEVVRIEERLRVCPETAKEAQAFAKIAQQLRISEQERWKIKEELESKLRRESSGRESAEKLLEEKSKELIKLREEMKSIKRALEESEQQVESMRVAMTSSVERVTAPLIAQLREEQAQWLQERERTSRVISALQERADVLQKERNIHCRKWGTLSVQRVVEEKAMLVGETQRLKEELELIQEAREQEAIEAAKAMHIASSKLAECTLNNDERKIAERHRIEAEMAKKDIEEAVALLSELCTKHPCCLDKMSSLFSKWMSDRYYYCFDSSNSAAMSKYFPSPDKSCQQQRSPSISPIKHLPKIDEATSFVSAQEEIM